MGTANISTPIAGGKRRVIVGRSAESAWGTADSLDSNVYVFNPVFGSGGLYPPKVPLLDNADSAQGQGMALTHRYEGAIDLQGTYKFWLTAQSFGRFLGSLMGGDSVTTVGTTGYRHAITLSATNEVSPFTLCEHMNGATDTTDAAKFTGCYCDKIVVRSSRGQQFATIEPDIVASNYTTADACNDVDLTSNWSTIPGIPHTRMQLKIKGSNDYASALTAANITFPTAPGTCPEGSSSPTDWSAYVQDLTLTVAANVDREKQYAAGTGTSSGFTRGKAYAPDPTIEIAATLDYNATSASWLRWLSAFATSAPAAELSYTVQLSWISDSLISGGTCYEGLCVAIPSMTVIGDPSSTRDAKANTVTVTFGQAQAASGTSTSLFYGFSWDYHTAGYATA